MKPAIRLGAKPHSKNHRTVRAPGTGLSSFLQLQPLGKSQRIAIAPMHSEQPRSSLRHHRTTGGQYPHAKLYPLPLASSKKPPQERRNKFTAQTATFLRLRIAQGAKTRILVRKRRKSATKRPIFALLGSRRESLIAKKLQKHSVFLFSQWVDRRNGANYQRTDRRNGAKSSERRRSLQSQESPVRFDDMHSGGCPRRPIVPHADSHCSHR